MISLAMASSKEYHEIRWATLRAMVDPKVADRIIIPHLEYLRSSKVIAGVVKSCTENEVATADGNVYQFDYLIIATDTKPEPPIPFQDRVWYFHKSKLTCLGKTTLSVPLMLFIVNEGPLLPSSKSKITSCSSSVEFPFNLTACSSLAYL